MVSFQKMAFHNELGKAGEQIAADYLKKKGYRIITRNWRYRKAEIDIIAEANGVLVVIEVKTRSSNHYGNPQDFISKEKIRLLVLATDAYITKKEITLQVRFDIVSVLIPPKKKVTIQHIEDGFFHF